jgi:hypothetical protein
MTLGTRIRSDGARRFTPGGFSHAVVLEYFLTGSAQLGAVLLQALLDGSIVTQVLSL